MPITRLIHFETRSLPWVLAGRGLNKPPQGHTGMHSSNHQQKSVRGTSGTMMLQLYASVWNICGLC